MGTAPSGYQTPKTNWAAGNIPTASDFNRIEGNIQAVEEGSRTIDPTQAPAGNSGSLRQFLDWLANRIKAITGKNNWYDAPSKTLEDLNTHINAAAPHIGHETPAGAQAKVDAHASKVASMTELGHVKHAVLTATIDTSWPGTSPPYIKTVTVTGILATDNPIVDVVMSGDFAIDQQRQEEWAKIYRITTANDSITLYATEKPTIDLPIQIKVVR